MQEAIYKGIDWLKKMSADGEFCYTTSNNDPGSQNIEELDRFISALLSIRDEIDNKPELLKNAPHSLSLLKEDWKFDYSQKDAFYPNNIEKDYFPSVNRVNDVYGDRNIIRKS